MKSKVFIPLLGAAITTNAQVHVNSEKQKWLISPENEEYNALWSELAKFSNVPHGYPLLISQEMDLDSPYLKVQRGDLNSIAVRVPIEDILLQPNRDVPDDGN